MNYLSEKLIVHMDLATRNCLLTEAAFVKLGDFGFAEQLTSSTDFIKLEYDIEDGSIRFERHVDKT